MTNLLTIVAKVFSNPFMVTFLHNLDIFVWLQLCCLASTVFTLDPSNSAIKGLWCNLRR